MIGVVTELPEYILAVGELSRSAVLTTAMQGSVAVIDGAAGWPVRAEAAISGGAAAIVVSGPEPVSRNEVDQLRARAAQAPVVLDRALLRGDTVQDARAGSSDRHAALVTAVCATPASNAVQTVVDVAGWLREFAGTLSIGDLGGISGGALALLDGTHCSVSFTLRVLADDDAEADLHARVRITAVAERRTEVTLSPVRNAQVRFDAQPGTTFAPIRFESRQRAALRRALELVAQSQSSPDLADFAADLTIAEALAGSVAS